MSAGPAVRLSDGTRFRVCVTHLDPRGRVELLIDVPGEPIKRLVLPWKAALEIDCALSGVNEGGYSKSVTVLEDESLKIEEIVPPDREEKKKRRGPSLIPPIIGAALDAGFSGGGE